MRKAEANIRHKKQLLQQKESLQHERYRACEIESTGITQRDNLRRKLVDILRQARQELVTVNIDQKTSSTQSETYPARNEESKVMEVAFGTEA